MVDVLQNVLGLDLIMATIRICTALVFAALACLYAERSGILNIGVEGMMLAGAFAASIGAVFSGNLYVGVLTSIIVGLLMGLLIGFITINLAANQIVVGITLNILVLGITNFLLRLIFSFSSTDIDPTRTAPFPTLHIPVLSQIPFIGPILFDQEPLVYFAFALIPISSFILFRTRLGLILRSAGESARAVDAAGYNVYLIRYIGITVSGVLSALGGAYLTLGWMHVFSAHGVTMGRGFIGLAALIFGGWKPYGALMGCLLFASGEALQIRLQLAGVGVRFTWLQMIPYLLTLIALFGVVGRSLPPAEEGIPYLKE